MTSPIRQIRVECPCCGHHFDDFYRGSINLAVEGWDANDPEVREYMRQCSTATCPVCGCVADFDLLVVSGGV